MSSQEGISIRSGNAPCCEFERQEVVQSCEQKVGHVVFQRCWGSVLWHRSAGRSTPIRMGRARATTNRRNPRTAVDFLRPAGYQFARNVKFVLWPVYTPL